MRFKSVIRFLGLSFLVAMLAALPAFAQTVTPTMSDSELVESVMAMENRIEGEYERYFGQNLAEVTQTPTDIGQTLTRISEQNGSKAAVIWVIPRETHLHLVLITPNGQPIMRDLYDVPRELITNTVQGFHRAISRPTAGNYLSTAQKLHQWIIEPLEAEYLKPQNIDTILFCLGDGIRGLALSALHDGDQFLVEKYNLTTIPAFNLIQTDYANIQQGQLLAMGASEFTDLSPLPGVPIELSNIVWELRSNRNTRNLWQGRSLLNEDFTLENVNAILANQAFEMIHIATHAEFKAGAPENSYIQFWDSQLNLAQARQVRWNPTMLELLVLSACETAVGDANAEMGFAGLALQMGVKSAVASLWSVSDAGTLALMSEFYRQLALKPTKAAALRQAQLNMLNGEVRFENNRLRISRGEIPLPEDLSEFVGDDLRHPFYWAGFTMISSPW
jgi:CHAT domain-containing protein